MAATQEPIQPEVQELNVDDVKLKEDVVVATPQQQQQPGKLKAKKIGHRRVDASTGVITYKKTPSSALSGSIQLGISHTVAGLSSKPERDVLMQDFQVVETISFPAEGSNITPAHHFGDFTFRTYAPTAFRYFRDLFGIRPDDYMLSISNHPLTELSNPGASGSLFFVTHDDAFIIKTVQHKEAEFLQKLLPGYYLNLVQNPRTLLPKFYGLYNVQSSGKNIRVCVMNNLLPSTIKMNLKYDLKGSTYKRKASKKERNKKNPTYKDLDLLNDLSEAPLLDPEIQNALVKTMHRDCLVLQSFKIMDYSMLLAIHNIDQQEKEDALKAKEHQANSYYSEGVKSSPANAIVKRDHSRSSSTDYNSDDTLGGTSTSHAPTGNRPYYSNLGAVMSSTMLRNKYEKELDHWSGGIPARNSKGEKLLLFCGIIDILQCYKLKKKLEHTLKAFYADSDAVSVHRPAFYSERFQKYMVENVFRPIKSQPTAKRNRSQTSYRPQSASATNIGGPGTSSTLDGNRRYQERPDLLPEEPTVPNSSAVSYNKESFPPRQSEVIQTTQISPPTSQTLNRGSKETTFDSIEEKEKASPKEEISINEKDHSPTTTMKQPSSTIKKEPEDHTEELMMRKSENNVAIQENDVEEDTDEDTAL